MTTKKSSGPVTICSQQFKDQKEENLVVKKEDPIALRKLVLLKASRKLVRTLSAILLVIPCSQRLSFLRVKGIGLPLQPTIYQQKVCLHRDPR